MKKTRAVVAFKDMITQLSRKYGVTPKELIQIVASHNGDTQAAMADLESRIK